MERVVFLCGLVGPHVVRYLIENMVIKMTRNNGRRTFCPVLQNGPIKIRKRLENLNSTPANLCDVISSTQPYFHICRDTNLSGGVGGGCVVDCCVPYMENLFDFSGTDGTGVHIIIVNTCQKIYLNSVVGIFSTCLCYAWTWFFSFITRRQRVTSGNRMEMLYIGLGSVQLDCFDRPNILVIKSILAFDGTLTKQNAQSKRQMPIEWIKFGMPFSMPKYVDNENWKFSNDGHCRWIYLAYEIVSTLFYEICAVNWNDVFFPRCRLLPQIASCQFRPLNE